MKINLTKVKEQLKQIPLSASSVTAGLVTRVTVNLCHLLWILSKTKVTAFEGLNNRICVETEHVLQSKCSFTAPCRFLETLKRLSLHCMRQTMT